MTGDDRSGTATERSGFVALCGWTNVGKSTLLNRMLGEKVAAVAGVPQTTRNRITGVLSVTGRGQIVFVDTPGFHQPRYRMNRNMVELARESMLGVDLALLVIDAERGPGAGDRSTARILLEAGRPAMAVLNKIDRVKPKSRLLPMIETVTGEWGLSEAIPVSALTGDGCDRLLDRLLERLPQAAPLFPPDYLTDQPERTLAAEWIREALLQRTRQEVPHALAVVVDRWEEREGTVHIDASILVERESQKAIVIGKGGEMLKQAGRRARLDLERLLGTGVMLRLWARVQKDWRNDAKTLRRLGLG